MRSTPGIIKINGSQNTRYLYEDLKDYSAIAPITLETPNAELSLQTIKAKLISEHDVLILKRKKNRIVRILYCVASGPIKNTLSARIADEIQIEFTAWQMLTSKYKTPLLPKVRLHRNNHIGLLLILDYSNMILSVTSGCFDTNIKKLGSTYGEISDMDNEIRNEILEYYKIINGNDYIGNLTFFVGPDLRLHAIPAFFRLICAVNANRDIANLPSLEKAKNFWSTVGARWESKELNAIVQQIKMLLKI